MYKAPFFWGLFNELQRFFTRNEEYDAFSEYQR